MAVVADTSPINYLVLIEHADILKKLYGHVVIPAAVRRELLSSRAPEVVRDYMLQPPSWLAVDSEALVLDGSTGNLDPGEREAIHLAQASGADKVILDDLLARQAGLKLGLVVIGTLGVLRDAARLDFIDIRSAVRRLQETSFNVSKDLIHDLLQEFN